MLEKDPSDKSINKNAAVRGIIPVVNFTDPGQVAPYLDALLETGLPTLEITLRNEHSFAALQSAMRYRESNGLTSSELLIGVGSILTLAQLREVADLGVDYMLSPGIDESLLGEAEMLNLSYIPGVATATEIMLGIRFGCKHFKLFPASLLGGVAAIKALGGPFPDIQFCPTGGVSADNLSDYLALPNVFAVGGSWLADQRLLAAGEWQTLRQLMRAAVVVANG